MRWTAVFALTMGLAACSERQVDEERDFTTEVHRICEAICVKADTCADPPIVEYEICIEGCLQLEGPLYDDTVCGEAYRDFYDCVGGTATCEEYLDTLNVHAEDFTCEAENFHLASLHCGAQQDGN